MDLLNHISAMAAGALVAAVWEGLVLAAGVALCLRLLPRITAAARSVIWSAVMVMAVLLPFLHAGGTGSANAMGSRPLYVDERLSAALACVWAAMSLFRAVSLIRSAFYLRGIAGSAEEFAVEPRVAALLQHRRRVAVCVSEKVDRPSVAGFFAPKILLPLSLLEKLSEAELEQIVLHEMEHLRRGDDWTNLLQKLSLVAFPLNPVLVWIERRLCLERELACDDEVLRATKARKAYAACLATLAEHSLVRRGVSLALGAWERQPELVQRVHRILSRSGEEMGRRQLVAAVSAIMVALFFGAAGLAHSPELVSFSPRVVTASTAAMPLAQQGLVGGHVVLAEAIVPERRLETAARRHRRSAVRVLRPAQTAGRLRSVAFRQVIGRTPQTAVVLVGWSGDEGSPTVQTLGFSYAAVPVRNGWLVFQL